MLSTEGGPDARAASCANGDEVEDVGVRSLHPAIAAAARRETASDRRADMGCTSASSSGVSLVGRRSVGTPGSAPGGAGSGYRKKPKTGSKRLTALLPLRDAAAYDLPGRPPERLAGGASWS